MKLALRQMHGAAYVLVRAVTTMANNPPDFRDGGDA